MVTNKTFMKILYDLFQRYMYGHSIPPDAKDYGQVDMFYGYLGYELEFHNGIPEIGITSTSALQSRLINIQTLDE